jgi:CHAT domain-containing protein/Tfp pilus assembly protein PilF
MAHGFGGSHKRQVLAPSLSRQQTGAIANDQKPLNLYLDRPVEKEIADSQTHDYGIQLEAEQFAALTIQQRGVDVLDQLLSPDGSENIPGQSKPSDSGQQNSPQVIALELGQPIEREISGGQKHAYRLDLSAGQYAKLDVEQRGIDVVVRLFGPDGTSITEVDAESRLLGQEILELVAEGTGVFKIEIEPKYKSVPPGRYEIRVLELRGANKEDSELDEARRLHTQARRDYAASKYDEAIRTEEKSLNIRERILGANNLDVAESLFARGLYCRNAGDIPRAEDSYLRALAIREKALGAEHPDVSLVLNNLGYLYYYDLHDYDRAESLYERSIAIKEKAFGAEHPQVATTLINIGLIEWKRKDYARAKAAFERALGILEKNNGPESDLVAACAHNLGIVYKESGDYATGEAYYRRALRVWEKVLGRDHPRVALALESLGILYRDKGDYANAEPFLLRALDIELKGEGSNHPDVANTLVVLAKVYEAEGDVARAVEFQARASAIEEKNIALNLSLGSERQKIAYFASMARKGDRRISLHVRSAPDDPKARELALTMILQRKGRVLDALADPLAALRQRFSAQDQMQLDQLTDASARLARIVLDGPAHGEAAADYNKKIKGLEEQRETLEEEISRRSAGLYQPSRPVTLDAIRKALPENAALVEFAIYHPSDPKATVETETSAEPRYVVYVIRSQDQVQWKDLGATNAIDAALDSWRQALRDPQRKDVQELARSLDEKVMRPVRALIGDATQLLISPDGELNMIPFGALVDEQGRYLIERFSITYLTSGRDLLRLQVARQSKSPPVVVADPVFGDARLIGASEKAAVTKGVGSSIRARIDYSRMFFGPLPGVKDEVRALRELLPDSSFLTQEQATKAALQRVVAPSLLHIATHGFFLAVPTAIDGGSPGQNQSISANANVENPLLRSGLALAGANHDDQSGILTALEASGLNLWGTKLVVLSACDTGLGEVRNGEGVYGLRRAFVLAGAESQVMSLWPVSDRSTRELMVGYYEGLLGGQGRGEALRRVQLEMLRNKNREHPYYWASFIQTGAWTNLEGKR